MSDRPVLVCVDQVPAGVSGVCAFYDGRRVDTPGVSALDVRDACHRAQATWSRDLVQWHDAVVARAAEGSPWAWCCAGSRLHVWQEPVRSLLFALGVARCLAAQTPAPERVYLVGAPRQAVTYLEELLGQAPRRSSAAAGRFWRMARRLAIDTLTVVRKKVGARASTVAAPGDMLVYSFGLSADAIRDRGDHFFGVVFDQPPFHASWLYVLEDPARQQAIADALEARRRDAAFDHGIATWGDIMWAWWTAARVAMTMTRVARQAPAFTCAEGSTAAFTRDYMDRQFCEVPPVGELVTYRAVARRLATRPPRVLCYPYEEKGLEHALLLASAHSGKDVTTVGFAHAAYNSGLLYVHEAGSSEARPPRPTVIVTGGEGVAGWFQTFGHRQDRLTAVGSPRWLPQELPPRAAVPGAPLHLLFITGFSHELRVLAEWIREHPDAFSNCLLTVRPNPTAWQDEQSDVLPALAAWPFVQVSRDQPLHAQFAASDVVLFCSTSAVAEAVGAGRVAVYAEFSDLWVTHPLEGKPFAEAVPHCRVADELARVLSDIRSMTGEAYDVMLERQRRAAAQVYAPFDPQKFQEAVRVH